MSPHRLILALLAFLFAVSAAHAAVPVTLKGSPASMSRQHTFAEASGYLFARTEHDIDALVDEGALVPLPGNADYRINDGVSNPYARPAMRLFIERLAAQYRAATGEQLVVTSLTRPRGNQPRNAHALSVHPTGMAVDLRISQRTASRKWLESTLLSLEARGVLDVTRERYPPHYHVALFPERYLSYVDRMIGPEAVATALLWEAKPAREDAPAAVEAPADTATAAVAAPREPQAPAQSQDWLKLLVILPIAALTADAVRRRRVSRSA